MKGRPVLLACVALVAATVESRGQQPSTSITVRAKPAVVLTADCSRAATGGAPGARPSPDAIKICQAAVAAADAASTEATYERQGSRTYLADSYMFAQRWSEAIPMRGDVAGAATLETKAAALGNPQ